MNPYEAPQTIETRDKQPGELLGPILSLFVFSGTVGFVVGSVICLAVIWFYSDITMTDRVVCSVPCVACLVLYGSLLIEMMSYYIKKR